MATFRAVILTGKHHVKADGTTNVKIRITHHRQNQYISTDLYVVPDDWKDAQTGDPFMNSRIIDHLATYNHRYLALGDIAQRLTALELKRQLMIGTDMTNIDFWEFADRYMADLKRLGKKGSIRGFRGPVAKLKAFRPSLKFADIDRAFLTAFEAYMIRSGELYKRRGYPRFFRFSRSSRYRSISSAVGSIGRSSSCSIGSSKS